ncbi:MAG: hypothetical protein GY830_02780 [Bacteroidetes bacterium]|nr:hypothetical protein [Bacteroidota bacterium]
MSKKIIIVILLILGTIFLVTFKNINFKNKKVDLSKIKIDIDIDKIDQLIYEVAYIDSKNKLKTEKSKKDILIDKRQKIVSLLNQYPNFKNYFLRITNDNEKEIIDQLIKLFNDPYQKKILVESKRIFGNLNNLKNEIIQAFKYIKFYFPNFKVPKIFIFSTGYANDIFIHKDFIVIDLSYFFGKASEFGPTMPEYLIKDYYPDKVIVKIILLLSREFNSYDINDSTLMGDMVYYGKAYLFAKHMLPTVNYQNMFNYNSQNIKFLKKNKSLIWEYFINNKLLYSKNKEIKSQFIDEAPFTNQFGKKSSSKIGRWVGLDIVKCFMKNNDLTLKELMQIKDFQYIFTKSKYTIN